MSIALASRMLSHAAHGAVGWQRSGNKLQTPFVSAIPASSVGPNHIISSGLKPHLAHRLVTVPIALLPVSTTSYYRAEKSQITPSSGYTHDLRPPERTLKSHIILREEKNLQILRLRGTQWLAPGCQFVDSRPKSQPLVSFHSTQTASIERPISKMSFPVLNFSKHMVCIPFPLGCSFQKETMIQ